MVDTPPVVEDSPPVVGADSRLEAGTLAVAEVDTLAVGAGKLLEGNPR